MLHMLRNLILMILLFLQINFILSRISFVCGLSVGVDEGWTLLAGGTTTASRQLPHRVFDKQKKLFYKDRIPLHSSVPLNVALFDMPNLNRFDILSISIFCKIALSISISISIFSKITISISISISIFLELPYRYRYRYRYFSELPYRYRYRYRYFQLLHIDIDIDIDIFQKCRYIDNRYVISIYRTGLAQTDQGTDNVTYWAVLDS